MLVITD